MITIDPEFRDFIFPPSPADRADLERSIRERGGADVPLIVWDHEGQRILVDGHNRYEICTRLGLPYKVDLREFPDRAAVKRFMAELIIASGRAPKVSQIVMLAALNGLRTERGTRVMRSNAAELVRLGPDAYGPVLRGEETTAIAYRKAFPDRAPKLRPRAPQGPAQAPTTPHVPEAHEIRGVSTFTVDGEVSAQWTKTGLAGADPEPLPDGFMPRKISRFERADGTVGYQHVSYAPGEVDRVRAIIAAINAHAAKRITPAPATPAPGTTDADTITLYPLGDPHVGMLAWAREVGESFDLRIGERELCACMPLLVARAPASSRAIVTNLGDFWHAQDDNQRTPRGQNKLDVDGRAGKVLEIGLAVAETLVRAALAKHEQVTFRSLPGNHDPQAAYILPSVLRRTFANEPRVTVEDAFAPYQFDTFGANLFGWCHGDGAKLSDLPGIMATDVPELWGAATFRYWHVGHVHHWSQKELPGCVVETHRTLAGRDAWHHHSGYRSGRALKALTYHRTWGLDSVAVVGIERVRAALEGRAA